MDTQTRDNLLKHTAENNTIYKFFAQNDDFWNSCQSELIKTPWRDTLSENSLTFKVDDTKRQAEILKSIFEIKDEKFVSKYDEAIGGNGHEGNKIMTLHSSSLLSFLCFYKISNEQPLPLSLCINGRKVNFEFTNSVFEHQNRLSYAYEQNSSYPELESTSNIDIALSEGILKESKNVLFLESKFSEYLHNGAVYDISQDAYSTIYKELGLTPNGDFKKAVVETYYNKEGKHCYKMKERDRKRTNAYLEGVKQMISHFLGACTYAATFPDKEVYLGSIIYMFNDPLIDKDKFSNYSTLYTGIMDALKTLIPETGRCSNLHLINNLLTYNDVFSKYKLDDKVAQYYDLGKKK